MFPDEEVYSNYGFQSDDERMIAKILTDDWSLEYPSIKDENQLTILFDEETDVAQYDYRMSTSSIKIIATDISVTPRGISFDSEFRKRTVLLYINARGRDEAIAIADECRRIIHRHRNRPGNKWAMMYAGEFKPIRPNFNFYQGVLTVYLKDFCRILPPPIFP